jgi:Kef-type K+ transport system membrane component KefB
VIHLIAPSLGFLTAAFVAVTLAITALPVMAVMVRELGLVDRELGRVLMAAALINELSAVTVFAILLQLQSTGGHASWLAIATALGATALFLAVVFTAYFLLQAIHSQQRWTAATGRFLRTVRSQEAGFALVMVLSLGAALLSQYLGLTFVIGAFYAGILVTPTILGKEIYDRLRRVLHVFMWGLFIPLFFAITGLQTNFTLLTVPVAAAIFGVLVIVAMSSKVGVGAILARLGKWSSTDSVALGFLVNSRGAVEIAMAVILYTDGILNTFWLRSWSPWGSSARSSRRWRRSPSGSRRPRRSPTSSRGRRSSPDAACSSVPPTAGSAARRPRRRSTGAEARRAARRVERD